MRKMIAISVIAALAATNAYAGVAETKAKNSAEQSIAEVVAKTKAACGNSALEVSVAWDQVEVVTQKNAELIEKKNSKPAYVIGEIANRASAAVEALGKICAEDADYKAEIAKLNKVEVTPKQSYDDYSTSFALNGAALQVESGFYMTRTASDFIKDIKAVF